MANKDTIRYKDPDKRLDYLKHFKRSWRLTGKEKNQYKWSLQTRANKLKVPIEEIIKVAKKAKCFCEICNVNLGDCRFKFPRLTSTAAIDHDHVTGEIRGLLCKKCNFAIGLFDDEPLYLESAVKYLNR